MTGELAVRTTAIPGLLLIDLPVHGDSRGWFKENWQRAKMVALGLPDFGPVQNNVSYNASVGVTRGIHAEPWDKLVSLGAGRIFAAWVDLRAGDDFGAVVTAEIGPQTAAFVPHGVGNSFQTLAPGTVYSYLVNDHWSPDTRSRYTFVNLADPALGIDWPVPLTEAELSEADRRHPALAEVTPMQPNSARSADLVPSSNAAEVLVLGAEGQLGRAVAARLPGVRALRRADCDLSDPEAVASLDLTGIDTVINAAAYTAVDAAETPQGRAEAWAVNVTGVASLAARCVAEGRRLVHVSTDYVFDGRQKLHDETEPVAPLGVYGQTKAAGDALVATVPRHLIVRTSWVIGEGRNFVATMAALAARGERPAVVNDQFGRLTFASDLAEAIVRLVETDAAPGVYNFSNSGPVQSWAEIAADVFALCGRDRGDVTPISTEEYGAGGQRAPRPRHSALNLAKITAAGVAPRAAADALRDYLAAD